jgi:hypothetical protein
MQHIEEHILELFVLGAKQVDGQRPEIQAHLRVCHGCRTLAEQMSKFYLDAEAELENLQRVPTEAQQKALVRVDTALSRLHSDGKMVVHQAPLTPVQRFRGFVRRHPVSSGVGSFALVAAIAAVLNLVLISSPRDKNPSYYKLNTAQDLFEVYNRRDEKLWQMPAPELSGQSEGEQQWNRFASKVVDLYGDGKSEVVTCIRCLGSESQKKNVLQILDADKKVIRRVEIGKPFHFLDTKYGSDFGTLGLVVDNFSGDERKEILVLSIHGRSPSVITRFDAQGNQLGQYWHFGQLLTIYACDLDNDGKKEIIASGINDVNDYKEDSYGVIVVLDPTKIVGDVESVGSPGFGFKLSTAEKYYIRLPNTDMIDTVHSGGPVRRVLVQPYDNENALIFFTQVGRVQDLSLDYVFSKQMKVLSVKSNIDLQNFRSGLIKLGKVTGQIDGNYLDNLKNSVMYWDGKEWNRGVVPVQHDLVN